ncbi:D-ribose pyranase [Celerinatantimonas yamalensis]|uniref:D-ribose pyranase n=1 Tax=Celerinatantimonas yamalensis TaxID=559956 RepID=A0ABW9G2E0_9GAMM
MKRSPLLHSEISYLIAKLGHTQEVTVGDAGLPIPTGVQRIDLAVTPGLPDFISTLEAILSEMVVEGIFIAEQTRDQSPDFYAQLQGVIGRYEQTHRCHIDQQWITHEDLKQRSQLSQAVIRTGECTPFANVILQAGVAF